MTFKVKTTGDKNVIDTIDYQDKYVKCVTLRKESVMSKNKAIFINPKRDWYPRYYGTYHRLSSITGINYRTLLRIVNNETECSLSNAILIAKALGGSVEDYFTLESVIK